MAHYTPDFYGDNSGESYQIPYYSSIYDIVPFQNSVSHDYGDPKFIGFDSSPYGGDYVPFPTRSETSYSDYVPTEPTKFIDYDPFPVAHSAVSEPDDAGFAYYDPTHYGGGYVLSPTRSQINYSAYVATEPTKVIQYDPFPVAHSGVSGLDDSEFAEYDPTPYAGDYDHFPNSSEINYSAYALTEPTKLFHYDPILVSHSAVSELDDSEFTEYDPNPYGGAYDLFATRSGINYSAYALSDPSKLIQYDPVLVSHSAVSKIDDSEFAEYEPTPYGGGYDPSLIYGKPLPPSNEICYPRSSPESNALSLDNNFSYGSIPSPYGGEDGGDSSKKPAEPVEEEQVGYGVGDSSTKPAESVEEEHVGYGDGESSTKPAESVEEEHVGSGDGESSAKSVKSVEEEHVGYDGHGSHPPGKPLDSEYNSWDEYYSNPWSGYNYGVGNERNGGCCCGCRDYKQEQQEKLWGLKKSPLMKAKRSYWEGGAGSEDLSFRNLNGNSGDWGRSW
ncbi:hypothetical protein U1Q18_050098 [Sarracenia purpurea var. burkii]